MIVVLDCETTGKDRGSDQIVELCLQLGLDTELAAVRVWRIKPTVPIHPEAHAIHGISTESLWDAPAFYDVAAEIEAVLREATVIVGYNVRFDLEMLQADLQRADRPPLDLSKVMLVDPLRLWQTVEPRTLEAAHERFVGGTIDRAHTSRADVAATAKVLVGMTRTFGVDPTDWVGLAAKSDQMPERHSWLGPTNHMVWRKGDVVLGFGKYAGFSLHLVDPGYLRWLLDKGFPPHVKEIARFALSKSHSEFLAWASYHYPEPAITALDRLAAGGES